MGDSRRPERSYNKRYDPRPYPAFSIVHRHLNAMETRQQLSRAPDLFRKEIGGLATDERSIAGPPLEELRS